MSVIEKVIEAVSPSWAAKRAAARANAERHNLVTSNLRGFNAVSKGRRAGDDWTKIGLDGSPTESAEDLATLRNRARDLSRNNPYWGSGKRAIKRQVVGFGIRATAVSKNEKTRDAMQKRWDAWASSNAADARGRLDLYGIQALVMDTVVSDGECLVRRVQGGTGIKLQVLGADYLSASKDGELPSGGEIVGGVETDEWGAAVAYHLHTRHPSRGGGKIARVDAKDIAHVYRVDRADQVRGESWVANVFTRLVNWDDYEDADLMRQKVAACFGVVYTGVNPSDEGTSYEPLEKLEPGMIEYLPNGTDMKTITPPASLGLRDTALISHRAVATGMGITYEALTGDFSNVTFSSSRMAHLQMAANVRDWQQQIMIDLFCERVWRWFVDASTLRSDGEIDVSSTSSVTATWTVQSRDMIDPEKETRANSMRVRAGFTPWSDVVRESGRDPEQVARQLAADNKRFDDLGLVLDTDPRRVSMQGQGAVNQKEEGKDVDAKDNEKA